MLPNSSQKIKVTRAQILAARKLVLLKRQ